MGPKRFLVAVIGVLAAVPAAAFECEGTDPVGGTVVTLEPVRDDLARPVDATAPAGDTERLFVVEQAGEIVIIQTADDSKNDTPFLDISRSAPVRCCGELGLLGLAFHPNYADNGYFFVYYTTTASNPQACSEACSTTCSADTVVSRFQVSADDPDVADPDSEIELLRFGQPFGNHNGGQIQFSPIDGYLYIATGDGGSARDPCNAGQSTDTYLGKILRIDVDVTDGDRAYGIPADNPFVDVEDVLPEIWALGLRNPWRTAFDPENGDFYIADVGQGGWEEIDYQRGDSPGGENYEWRRREGDHSHNGGTALTVGAPTGPAYEYPHGGGVLRGCSITGGVVYRGCRMPDLHGAYFFADYCNNWIATLRMVDGVPMDVTDRTRSLNRGIQPGDTFDDISAFGTDGRGEVYVCDLQSKLFRIVPDNPPNVRIATDPEDPTPEDTTVQFIGGHAEIVLDASATDDGNGGTQELSYEWELVEGPESATITEPMAASTRVEFSDLGDYTLRVTVDDGLDTATADVVVHVVFEGPSGLFRRGDTNTDGEVDISDGVFVLLFLFAGGDRPSCGDAADVDDSAEIDLTDAVSVFNFLFLDGVAPPAPGTACGPDPTDDDDIDCADYSHCP